MFNEEQTSLLRKHPVLSDAIRQRELRRHMGNGKSFDDATKQVIANFESRKLAWLNTCIKPWAEKHGITEQQAISVLFFDHTKTGPRSEDCFWAESNLFAESFMP